MFTEHLVKHKINRTWQHDYYITLLTQFNSQTGDNRIMDRCVFCAVSMGWCCFYFLCTGRYAALFRPVIFAVRCEWGRGEMKKGRYTAGRLKKQNTHTKIDKRKRSFTEVNFTILYYVGVFLLLANEINRCQCFVKLFFIGFFFVVVVYPGGCLCCRQWVEMARL